MLLAATLLRTLAGLKRLHRHVDFDGDGQLLETFPGVTRQEVRPKCAASDPDRAVHSGAIWGNRPNDVKFCCPWYTLNPIIPYFVQQMSPRQVE